MFFTFQGVYTTLERAHAGHGWNFGKERVDYIVLQRAEIIVFGIGLQLRRRVLFITTAIIVAKR